MKKNTKVTLLVTIFLILGVGTSYVGGLVYYNTNDTKYTNLEEIPDYNQLFKDAIIRSNRVNVQVKEEDKKEEPKEPSKKEIDEVDMPVEGTIEVVAEESKVQQPVQQQQAPISENRVVDTESEITEYPKEEESESETNEIAILTEDEAIQLVVNGEKIDLSDKVVMIDLVDPHTFYVEIYTKNDVDNGHLNLYGLWAVQRYEKVYYKLF